MNHTSFSIIFPVWIMFKKIISNEFERIFRSLFTHFLQSSHHSGSYCCIKIGFSRKSVYVYFRLRNHSCHLSSETLITVKHFDVKLNILIENIAQIIIPQLDHHNLPLGLDYGIAHLESKQIFGQNLLIDFDLKVKFVLYN